MLSLGRQDALAATRLGLALSAPSLILTQSVTTIADLPSSLSNIWFGDWCQAKRLKGWNAAIVVLYEECCWLHMQADTRDGLEPLTPHLTAHPNHPNLYLAPFAPCAGSEGMHSLGHGFKSPPTAGKQAHLAQTPFVGSFRLNQSTLLNLLDHAHNA